MSIPQVGSIARYALLPFLAGVVGLGFIYFGGFSAGILLLLALATWLRPAIGAALLFVVISIDTSAPLLGGIIVSLSELELATVLVILIARRGLEKIDWRPLLWLLPFLGVVFLSGIFKIEWYKVLPHVIRNAEIGMACVIAASAFKAPLPLPQVDPAAAKGSNIREFIVLAAPAAAVACTGCFFSIHAFLSIPEEGLSRVHSFFSNPNQFASYLAMLLPFCIVFLSTAKRLYTQALWVTVCVLVTGSLFTTLSRAGLVAACLGGLATVGLILRSRLRDTVIRRRNFTLKGAALRILLPILLLVSGMFFALRNDAVNTVFQSYVERFESRASEEQVEKEVLNHRVWIFNRALDFWKANPILGLGPGKYQESAQVVYKKLLEERLAEQTAVNKDRKGKRKRIVLPKPPPGFQVSAHNQYIQLLATLGLAGLVSFLYFLFRVGRGLEALLISESIALAGFGLLTVFIAHGFMDVTFPSLAMEMGLLLGMALAAPDHSDSRD